MAASYIYAQAFTTILVTMMYSGGCPILYPITFLNFVVVYWVYKMLLISHFKKSTSFDENLAFNTIEMFKWSVIIHLVTSLMMFTNHNILSSTRVPQQELNELYQLVQNNVLTANNPVVLNAIERFSHPMGLLYTVFILLIIAIYILRKTVVSLLDTLLSKLIRIFCCCFFKSDQDVELAHQESQKKLDRLGIDAFSQDFIADLQVSHLKNLY